MKIVHLIGNAHLDPVWLWRLSDGVGAVLATARSACDRLDEYPDFIFTCSGSWFHRQVELHDSALFERICRFVREGRWQLVGGMLIQPDCNLPSAESFAKQFKVGQQYFRDKFGKVATVGYNVDSFGHTGYLPQFLADAHIKNYVFMRPSAHEKQLSANLFRWCSPNGYSVTAFRISGGYTTRVAEITDRINESMNNMPKGIDHTMCFFGVGDHGGGPTKAQIEWILENSDSIEGVKLVFSHPQAFFDAIDEQKETLSVVIGELQHHAIGCYAVERRIKDAMRKAEAKLNQAEYIAKRFAQDVDFDVQNTIDQIWEKVLFNQFHDILGGTSITQASERATGELLWAKSQSDDLIMSLTQKAFRHLTEPGTHKIIAYNPSPEPFDGYLVHEPWYEADPWAKEQLVSGPTLLDEKGNEIEYQIIYPSANVSCISGFLFRLSIPAGGQRILTIDKSSAEYSSGPAAKNKKSQYESRDLKVKRNALANSHLNIRGKKQTIDVAGWMMSLDVIDDPTDTWSHSAGNRFDGKKLGGFQWRDQFEVVEEGPLRAVLMGSGKFEDSRAWLKLMLFEDEPMLRLHLSVVWSQVRQLLRLRLCAPEDISERTDLISGGPQTRDLDGLEYPLAGGMFLKAGNNSLGVVAPGVFSVSVDRQSVNLTLLRSPYIAHHDPTPAERRPDCPVADQGRHDFDLILWPDGPSGIEELVPFVRAMMMPPVVWDITG